jgi:hypothetical protein
MQDFAENVVRFNEEILKSQRLSKRIPGNEIVTHRCYCLLEEVKEYREACHEGDYIGAIDALLDLMYFAVGGLHHLGLTPTEMAECGRIVHQANMNKQSGKVERRAVEGVADAIKPVSYVPPEETMRKYLEVDHG